MSNKKIIWIFLIIFVILGAYLRMYNVDYPTIGYHNMKENEYVQEAKIMNDNGDWLHRKTFTFFGLTDNNNFDEYAQAPLIPWMTLPLWKMFGEQMWIPRMIIISFMLASIILIYFLVKKLTDSDYIALLSSFLMAIMPIGIFFGRNIQPEALAMFFSLLCIYFYLDWYRTFDGKYLLFSMLSLSMSVISKETFLITVIPLLFITPWKQIISINMITVLKKLMYGVLGLSLYVIVNYIFKSLIVDKSRIQMEAFSIAFERASHIDFWLSIWPAISSFLADNFTWWFVFLGIFGTCFALTKYKSLLGRLTIGYIAALIAYCGIISGKIAGHAYYHFPFLPIVCIMSAYFIYLIATVIKDNTNIKYVEYGILLLLLFTIPSVIDSNNRVFGTNFYGQDVIGEWLKDNKEPNSRLFAVATSQTYAVCTYAEMYCGEWTNESDMKYLEQKYNIKYLYVDMFRMQDLDRNKAWNYIQENYHIALVGLLPNNGQLSLYSMVLEKGGKLNMSDIEKNQPFLAKTYNTPYGPVPFYIAENT